jgi:hypothetical protein
MCQHHGASLVSGSTFTDNVEHEAVSVVVGVWTFTASSLLAVNWPPTNASVPLTIDKSACPCYWLSK